MYKFILMILILSLTSCSSTYNKTRNPASEQKARATLKLDLELKVSQSDKDYGKKYWDRLFSPKRSFREAVRDFVYLKPAKCQISKVTPLEVSSMNLDRGTVIIGNVNFKRFYNPDGSFNFIVPSFLGKHNGHQFYVECYLYKEDLDIYGFSDAVSKLIDIEPY